MPDPSMSMLREDFSESRQESLRRHNEWVLRSTRRRERAKVLRQDAFAVIALVVFFVGLLELLRIIQFG